MGSGAESRHYVFFSNWMERAWWETVLEDWHMLKGRVSENVKEAIVKDLAHGLRVSCEAIRTLDGRDVLEALTLMPFG